MNSIESLVGFYGKLPSHGDFVSRRLPRQFIESWDQWLQGGIAASQEKLAGQWLNTYLVSPIWQFALAPGLCGDDAWAGVMMPSVDKVGRYFPLTLVAKVNAQQLPQLFNPSCGWFAALSQLALSSLEYEFDLQQFDAHLQRLSVYDYLSDVAASGQAISGQNSSAKPAFEFKLDTAAATAQAFQQLGDTLKTRFLAQASLWRSFVTDDDNARLLVCQGLPPLDAYVGFLNGQWPAYGWQLASVAVDMTAVAELKNTPPQLSTVDTLPMPDPEQTVEIVHAVIENTGGQTVLPELINQRQSFGLSVVGLRRKLNEDAILVRDDVGLWVVADGMGGHSAGDVASNTLVETLARIQPFDDLEYYSEQVAANLQAVNRQLQQLAKGRGAGHIIGSTVVVLLIAGQQFRYLWAGDSRLYRYRLGKLEQLTQDHSLYNEAISQGLIPEDGSLEQGRGNVITRAVGADAQLQLDWGQGAVEPGDLFILSSDGLDKELSADDIAGFCASGSAEEIVRNLIAEAERRGGRDNISVIGIRV
jgi:type VI secretion system protein ImpM